MEKNLENNGYFQYDLKIGKIGEKIVKEKLEKIGHKVVDVSDEWDYRMIDVDFLVTLKNGAEASLEVKNSPATLTYGNIMLEYYQPKNYKRNGVGWFEYCEADCICWLVGNEIHLVEFSDFLTESYRKTDKYVWSDGSRCYAVPLEDIKKFPSYCCLHVA